MRFLRRRSKAAGAKPAAPRRGRRRGRLDGRTRTLLALGLLAAAAAGFGMWRLERSGGIAGLAAGASRRLVAETAHLGLAVGNIEVIGREMTSRDALLRAIDARRGTPIFAVSPEQIKARIEELPWVRSASVERRLPDTLRIRLVEREPFALWQHEGRLALIDRDGTVITDQHLERFPNLVIVVGDEAPRRAAALIEMLATEPELARRVVAAVLVGGRRWNLHFDNGIDVELPENGSAAAWSQLAKLDRSSRLLARDVQVVDMRLPDRLVVRVTPEPPSKQPSRKGHQAAKNT